MFKYKISDETRIGLIFVLSLLAIILVMYVVSVFLGWKEKKTAKDETKERTVIVTQGKESASPQSLPPKSVTTSVRDALKQGNLSTAYMVVGKASTTSPENDGLHKQISEEIQKNKTRHIRKDGGISPSAPVRYFDESTPRDRSSNSMYLYFVDISGTLFPRFCIQVAAKRHLDINRFTIVTDRKKIELIPTSMKFENTEKGVAEWYDAPLGQREYDVVHAIITAKRVSLTATGKSSTTTRQVTDGEIKGFQRILDGYAALGGSLGYLRVNKQ